MKHHALYLLLCISLLFTTSCAPSRLVEEPAPVSETTQTSTPAPATETMTATPLPTVTATSLPTATAIPEVSSIEEAIPLYGYDPSQPLLIEEKNPVKEQDGVKIYDISFYGPSGGIRAYLVVPPGEGPFPGIVYAHWLGDIWSNRDEFLNEAIDMGGHGIASVLIQQVFPWKQKPKNIARDRLAIIKQVISIRRCVDVLLDGTYVNVNPEQIAFVGHDYGAMHAYLLTAEHPAMVVILIASVGGSDLLRATSSRTVLRVTSSNARWVGVSSCMAAGRPASEASRIP